MDRNDLKYLLGYLLLSLGLLWLAALLGLAVRLFLSVSGMGGG